jgi:hypothetical protein
VDLVHQVRLLCTNGIVYSKTERVYLDKFSKIEDLWFLFIKVKYCVQIIEYRYTVKQIVFITKSSPKWRTCGSCSSSKVIAYKWYCVQQNRTCLSGQDY